MPSRLILILVTLLPGHTIVAQEHTVLPAWIEVTCPADVTLTIQGHRLHSTGTHRRFASPPLPTGQPFTYELRAYRGRREVAHRQVDVEAGRTTHVTITADATLVNFGIDVDQLRKSAPPAAGDDALPDPARRRLTIIGPQADRQRARDELAGPLRTLAADYVVQDYAPDHWAVTKPGFLTTGRPTVYAQEPDGRVLFRQDDLDGLRFNLEAVRKPSPDYHPDRDPDHRQSPALNWREVLPFAALALSAWLLTR